MTQDEASTGELLSRLSEQLSTLVRDEAALAVVEVKSKARAAGLGIGVLAGAGLFGFLGLCALVVIAGGLGTFALLKLRKSVPQETVANVKDDADIIRRVVTR